MNETKIRLTNKQKLYFTLPIPLVIVSVYIYVNSLKNTGESDITGMFTEGLVNATAVMGAVYFGIIFIVSYIMAFALTMYSFRKDGPSIVWPKFLLRMLLIMLLTVFMLYMLFGLYVMSNPIRLVNPI